MQKALRALEADGLVRQVTDGPAGHCYERCTGRPLVHALRAVQASADVVPMAIAVEVHAWAQQPRCVALFGPFARHEDADRVDLLIVWGEEREEPWGRVQLLLDSAVRQATGIRAAISAWTSADWSTAVTERDPFVLLIANEGVRVIGESLWWLTRGIASR